MLLFVFMFLEVMFCVCVCDLGRLFVACFGAIGLLWSAILILLFCDFVCLFAVVVFNLFI